MRARKSTYLLCAFIAAIIVGCRKDEPASNMPADTCYDFVTLGLHPQAASDFTFFRSDGQDPIVYTSKFDLSRDTTFWDGQRLIIAYTRVDAMPYTSGPINLYGYRLLDNTEQNISDCDTIEESDPLKATALTLTAPYINLTAQLSCTRAAKAKALIITADESTLKSDCPVLNILYKAADPGKNTFTGYASFDISQILGLPTCREIKVNYTTFNGIESKTFIK